MKREPKYDNFENNVTSFACTHAESSSKRLGDGGSVEFVRFAGYSKNLASFTNCETHSRIEKVTDF